MMHKGLQWEAEHGGQLWTWACRDLWEAYSASVGFPKFLHHHCDGIGLRGGIGLCCKKAEPVTKIHE
jgi:hypothetical protein